MKEIVLGGAGFIGSHLVDKLVEQGHQVIVLDDFSTGQWENLEKSKDKITVYDQKLHLGLDWEAFKTTSDFQDIDCIIHLAALPRIGRSIDNPVETHEANVNGTLAALEMARILQANKFIFASSSSVYGQVDPNDFPIVESTPCSPESPYATQKLIGEEYCKIYKKIYGVNTIMLRFFNAYGDRMDTEGAYKLVFANWIEQIREGKKLSIFGDGEQTRDFTHVDDIVSGIISAINLDEEIASTVELPINLCTGKEVSVNQLSEYFNHDVIYIENPRLNEERRKVGSNNRAKDVLDWEPKVSLKEGIARLTKSAGVAI